MRDVFSGDGSLAKYMAKRSASSSGTSLPREWCCRYSLVASQQVVKSRNLEIRRRRRVKDAILVNSSVIKV